MSVYTRVEREELEAFLRRYEIGPLVDFRGISAGIENTNYFVTTADGEWVLTLFETVSTSELPYFLNLMHHLARRGLPTAAPLADREGGFLQQLNARPAALVRRLPGASPEQPNAIQCEAMGEVLARMHEAGQDYPATRQNSRGPAWWTPTAERLAPVLAQADARLLHEELAFQRQASHADLPCGVVHGDLFHDNVLFEGDRLTGVIDFYYACNDVLLYDLAVAVNDWCSDGEGRLDDELQAAVFSGYSCVRSLAAVERSSWNTLLRAAALRFWLSRLYDQHFPRAGEMTHTKDPQMFRRILLERIERPVTLPEPA